MEALKIYIDRLKNGQNQAIKETLTPEFLDIQDEELAFKDPVQVKAEAYVTDDFLVIHLTTETSAWLPCSICNESIRTPISIKNLALTIALEEIKGAIFDLTEKLRDTILLQTPLYTECNNGKCPERENLKKFLNSEEKTSGNGDHSYLPFSDLS